MCQDLDTTQKWARIFFHEAQKVLSNIEQYLKRLVQSVAYLKGLPGITCSLFELLLHLYNTI